MDNKIRQAFDSIRADTQLKESTKQFLSADRRKKARKKTGLIFALACATLFLIAGIRGYAWIQTPVSYVSIDVNPSMELALNSLDRVVSTSAYNTEGAKILNGLSLKGKKYTDAVKMIMESSAMDTYLAEDPDLVFTIASDKNRESALEAGVTDTSKYMGHNCHSVQADIETAAQAHDCGLSLGKYNAYLQLAQYDDTITVDQCRDMTMSEIHGLIREHQQEENDQDPEEHHIDHTDNTTHGQKNSHHGGHHQ